MTFKFTSVTLTFLLSSRLQIHFIHIHCCSVIQSCLILCDPMNCTMQASMSFTISQSLLKLMSVESMMSSNHLILCHPLLLPSIFSSIRVFSNESALCIRWPKYRSFNFSISPSNEFSGLISFKIDWFDLLAVQGTLKSLLQHHSLKASILWHSAFFMVQCSRPYMTTGKTIALTRQTFDYISMNSQSHSRACSGLSPPHQHTVLWKQYFSVMERLQVAY